MSSFAFNADDDPVPLTSPHDGASGCGEDWVCEHRRSTAATMVAFRGETAGLPVQHWQAAGEIISFSRGDRGQVIINVGDETADVEIRTGLPDGEHVDRLTGETTIVVVAGRTRVVLEPRSGLVFRASQAN